MQGCRLVGKHAARKFALGDPFCSTFPNSPNPLIEGVFRGVFRGVCPEFPNTRFGRIRGFGDQRDSYHLRVQCGGQGGIFGKFTTCNPQSCGSLGRAIGCCACCSACFTMDARHAQTSVNQSIHRVLDAPSQRARELNYLGIYLLALIVQYCAISPNFRNLKIWDRHARH
jgi:hypothetical protein